MPQGLWRTKSGHMMHKKGFIYDPPSVKSCVKPDPNYDSCLRKKCNLKNDKKAPC